MVRRHQAAWRSPRSAPSKTDAIRFVPENWSACITNGCTRSRIGASAASCGGDTAYRPGTTPTAAGTSRAAKPRPAPRTASTRQTPLRQDDDVLDTWFSSALWPFSTQGWPRRNSRAANLLSDLGAGHGLRHHFLLGRPHDHDGPEIHGRSAVPRSVRARTDPRSRRPEDVQVQGQRHRPARHRRWDFPGCAARQAHQRSDAAANEAGHREGDAQAISAGHRGLRHGCTAPVLRPARHAEPRSALRHEPGRGVSQLLQQAVERGALRADECRGSGPRQRRGAEFSLADRWIRARLAAHAGARGVRIRRLPARHGRQRPVRIHLA